MNKLYLPLILILVIFKIHPATLVYNLRIAQATKHRASELEQAMHVEPKITRVRGKKKLKPIHPFVAAVVGLDQLRHRKDGVEQNIGGGIGTVVWVSDSLYVRMDFAAAHLKEKKDGICTSHNQTDDILFSFGITRRLTDHAGFTFSGLFGIPTHKDEGLERLQLGTGHVGIGVQVDASFMYSANHPHHAILAAARLIHFFPGTACATILNQQLRFKADPGNFVDLLVAHYSRWGKNSLELGYNPAFAFGASLCPPLPTIPTTSVIRNSFYANYRRIFFIRDHASGVGVGVSYSFDNLPVFGFSRIGTVWVGWGINF